jgi:hypothetical protein
MKCRFAARIRGFSFVVLLLALSVDLEAQKNKSTAKMSPSPSVITNALANYAKLPLSFEVNQGQRDGRVKFFSRGDGYELFLTNNGASLVLSQSETGSEMGVGRNSTFGVDRRPVKGTGIGAAMSGSTVLPMTLRGADANPSVSGLEQLPGKANYFIGNDPKKWRTNVSMYAKVKYHGVYPGVDLVYYGNQDGRNIKGRPFWIRVLSVRLNPSRKDTLYV